MRPCTSAGGDVHVSSIRACARPRRVRRDALLDRAGSEARSRGWRGTKWMRKHGRRERACTSGWKRGRLKGSETCAEHKRPGTGSESKGQWGEGVRAGNWWNGEERSAENRWFWDEKAVRRDKLRDQGRHPSERTFLDENNRAPRASIGSHYDDDDRDDVTPRVPAYLSMIR